MNACSESVLFIHKMCTCFAVYNSRPIYGMNFDFPDVPLRFVIETGRRGEVFHLSFGYEDEFWETSGMNRAGLFVSGQILAATFEIQPNPHEALVHPHEIFVRALHHARRVEEVPELICGRRLAYTTRRKGHQFYAGRDGQALIVEPGPQGNVLTWPREPFAVMTNFPVWDTVGKPIDAVTGVGSNRYKTAHRMITANRAQFGIQEAFATLQSTAMQKGAYTTQSSMVCDPLAGEVYIAVRRDYNRIWRVSLADKTISTFAGFKGAVKLPLHETGISDAILARYN